MTGSRPAGAVGGEAATGSPPAANAVVSEPSGRHPGPTSPAVARTRGELARQLAAVRRKAGRLAVVMTMGALHPGHARLIQTARQYADVVVVTLFVNPLQFGPQEDYHAYPRTEAADLALCAAEGVRLVFAPPREVIYPHPVEVTVSAGPLGEILEGASRPGHFDGVLTVVAKLMNLIQPDIAVFGEKDAQQLALIRKMVRDLELPLHVVGVPTVREPDGLAMSSRNTYLSAVDRVPARALSAALRAGERAVAGGPTAVLAAATAVLAQEPRVSVDYLALVSEDDFTTVPPGGAGPARLLVAGRVGGTRLIDNLPLTLPEG